MKRTRNLKNLSFKTETVRQLSGQELNNVAGGGAIMGAVESGRNCNNGSGALVTSNTMTTPGMGTTALIGGGGGYFVP